MIEFEGKIKMIAVPVLGNEYAFSLIKLYNVTVLAYKYKTIHEGGDSSAIIVLPKGNDYAIIGLTSDILKSEELYCKCVKYYDDRGLYEDYEHNDPTTTNKGYIFGGRAFQSLLDKYNIKSEHLILEVK